MVYFIKLKIGIDTVDLNYAFVLLSLPHISLVYGAASLFQVLSYNNKTFTTTYLYV